MARRRRAFFDEKRFDPDVVDVLEAAALLQITEFELFRLAHRRWHGGEEDASDDVIESYYLPYMFRDRVPAFVRHLAREVVARSDEDRLDPRDFGILPQPVSADMYNRGLRYALWLVIIFGSLLTGAMAVAELAPWERSCYLPPCY